MFMRTIKAKNKDGSGRAYGQLVESRRIDGKPTPIVLAHLGRIDRDEDKIKFQKMAESILKAVSQFELVDLLKDLTSEGAKEYGPFLIYQRLFNELGMAEILRDNFKDLRADFDIVNAIFNMMLNRLSAPCSKRQMTIWEQNIEGIPNYPEHQYYRALDYLIEKKEEIEKSVFSDMRDLFCQELDIVLFDTTSLVYYGKGNGEEEKPEDQQLLDYGFSKAHRSDLKQVVVGVIMSKEGVPLGHEVWSGNTNDVKCFKEVIEQVRQKYGLSRIILVGDRGMISKNNIEAIEKSGLEYILGYRMRTIAKEERSKLLSQANLRKLKNSELEFKEVTYQGKRLIVCYNAERAEKDKRHRERDIEKLREKLKSSKSIKQLISNPQYKRFIKINETKTTAKLDEEKIKNDELYDGIFVLTTNTNLSAVQCVERYKDLWQVEHAFRALKSELEMGPIYHWKDDRIRAHIMVCFLAFCLRAAFYKKIAQMKEKMSITQVNSDLKALRAVELKIKSKTVKLRTELKEGASLAFKAIGMKVPNRILHSDIQTVAIHA